MDADMREKITMGMMVGCLLLALVAMFTTSWLVSDDDDVDMTASLSTMYSDDLDMEESYSDLASDCKDMVDSMTPAGMDKDYEACDEMDEAATAGLVGTICMWLGIVMALVMVLMVVLPMAGVDAMDNLPDMVGMVASWAAGGLMLLGVVLWLVLLPDGDSDMGYSAYLAIVAGLMGLGSTAMNTFMADE